MNKKTEEEYFDTPTYSYKDPVEAERCAQVLEKNGIKVELREFTFDASFPGIRIYVNNKDEDKTYEIIKEEIRKKDWENSKILEAPNSSNKCPFCGSENINIIKSNSFLNLVTLGLWEKYMNPEKGHCYECYERWIN